MDCCTFKLIHGELIQQVQCIEYDLKLIYTAMCDEDFNENFELLKKDNLGKIVNKLKWLDFSDVFLELSKERQKAIRQILQ